MKNIKKTELLTCIYKSYDDMLEEIKEMFGPTANINISSDGIDFTYEMEDFIFGETRSLPFEELAKEMTQYYDVKEITSIHVDDCIEQPGIWICYK